MKMLRALIYIGIGFTTAGMWMAFNSGKWPEISYLSIVLGGFWVIAQWRRWGGASNLIFAVNAILFGFAALSPLPLVWLSISLTGMVLAWDIGRWMQIMENAPHISNGTQLIRNHLIRLGGVLVIGLSLSLLAMNLDFSLSFEWVLILVFMMVFLLSRVVGYMRRG